MKNCLSSLAEIMVGTNSTLDKAQSLTVVLFIPTLGGGGAERVVVNLANGLSDYGDRIGILLLERAGVYFDELRDPVKLDHLGISSRIGRFLGFPRYISYLKARRPDVVLVSGHSAFLIALVGRLFVRHRLLVIVHNTVSSELGFSRFVARWLYRYADKIVAVSNGVAGDIKRYARIPPTKLRTIYNPVNTVRIRELSAHVPSHRWFKDPSLHIIVAVGSLTAQKNYKFLLQTIAFIKQKNAEVRLLILGEGHLRGELEDLISALGIEREVELIGFVKNPFAYMGRAQRFVLSSSFEGFGMVIVEALASGAKVVSTDCPSGPSEILEAGRWGMLVPLGDQSKLAAALVGQDDRFPSVDQARERASAFSLEPAVEAYRRAIYGQL